MSSFFNFGKNFVISCQGNGMQISFEGNGISGITRGIQGIHNVFGQNICSTITNGKVTTTVNGKVLESPSSSSILNPVKRWKISAIGLDKDGKEIESQILETDSSSPKLEIKIECDKVEECNLSVGNAEITTNTVGDVSNISGDITIKATGEKPKVGNVESKSGDIQVSANETGVVNTMSGDIKIEGTVLGRVSTMSGNVTVTGSVEGEISSTTGNISSGKRKYY